ncbi:MAG: helix-turn-helix transcriptional regulator [Anaerolineaceae bacterium]
MTELTDHIHERIKTIRKNKRRSIHDCATILGLSKETYLNIEKGLEPITLPELELLALYLEEDPSVFLSRDQSPNTNTAFLDANLRSQYVRVRDKMLCALIRLEKSRQAVTLGDIQQATHIPMETLQAYENGTAAIPAGDLIKISVFLGIQTDSLYKPLWLNKSELEEDVNRDAWQPEFPKSDIPESSDDEEPYTDIMNALCKVSKQDQAFIAKYLIEKLRSI